MNFIDKINFLLAKKKIRKTIYKTEIDCTDMGIANFLLFKKYAKVYKEDAVLSMHLSKIHKALERGASSVLVYREILDKDLLYLIDLGIKKGVDPVEIFRKYVPFKELGEETETSLKKKLYVPIIMFLLAVAGIYYTLDNFIVMAESGKIPFSEKSVFIMNNFLLINSVIGGISIYFFLIKPSVLPGVKGIFNKIRSMMLLAIIQTMSNMNSGTREILDSIKKQFSTSKTKKQRRRFSDDTQALLYFLKKEEYLTLLQSGYLEISVERGEFSRGIEHVLMEKKQEIADSRGIVDEVISKISLFLLLPPLLMVLVIFLDLMEASSIGMTGNMSGNIPR